ncbi:hypothetical protein F383_14985 [Gossypium arboreum]|uniref:Uncharacterized protein n=1 Tax=Gossypium arboreum TaxID=29729 RepID=A0A0B0PX57_GOSAR|nr:hypothetical protein F383_14985 [Gossypium arboreum]
MQMVLIFLVEGVRPCLEKFGTSLLACARGMGLGWSSMGVQRRYGGQGC